MAEEARTRARTRDEGRGTREEDEGRGVQIKLKPRCHMTLPPKL